MQYISKQTGEIVDFHGEISSDNWEEVKAPSSKTDDIKTPETEKKKQAKAVKK